MFYLGEGEIGQELERHVQAQVLSDVGTLAQNSGAFPDVCSDEDNCFQKPGAMEQMCSAQFGSSKWSPI